ncbi:MAG: adenylyltransferase/cytidyltransferase family protein [bacterium]|nr:adenylyltransferase/cytidyltransferase family protein [bacterium]
MSKILTYSQMKKAVRAYHDLGKKIVLTQGTYDLLHVGHGRYLEEAKKKGDVLIVGVDSDAKVKKRKGPQRPIVPEDERMEMVSYLSSVDHVVLKPLKTEKWSLIKLVRPDVLVATKATYDKKELAQLKNFCGEVKVLEPKATTSTSAKIRLVQLGMAEEFSNKLKKKLLKQIQDMIEEMKVN